MYYVGSTAMAYSIIHCVCLVQERRGPQGAGGTYWERRAHHGPSSKQNALMPIRLLLPALQRSS